MSKILVVDDTPNIRKMVRLTLVSVGHSVEIAADGAQGLEIFGDGTGFDLTLVDQHMPNIEGREMISAARKRDPMARLIMMTAFATGELAAEVLQSGALDFLRKPFSTETLRSTVAGALSQPRHEMPPESASQIAELPHPGEADFLLPRLSFRFNGFSFWPVSSSTIQEHPAGIEFGRTFQVRHPDGALKRCFVGITPHIRAETERDAGHEIAPDDVVWERLCGMALLNFLWENSGAPPEILPVYEMPKSSRNSHLVPWKRFSV